MIDYFKRRPLIPRLILSESHPVLIPGHVKVIEKAKMMDEPLTNPRNYKSSQFHQIDPLTVSNRAKKIVEGIKNIKSGFYIKLNLEIEL